MKFQPTTRGIVFSACFSALFVLSSYLNLQFGFSPIPISLENLVVMLAGAILGPVYGFISIALVIGLTALGLPIINGHGGLALLLGPTGGFIWMYPFAALLIGLVAQQIKASRTVSLVLMFISMEVFGSLLLYVSGVPWLAHVAGLSYQKALALGFYPFLPGDAIKAVIAASIAITVREVFPLQRIVGTSR